MGTTHNTTWLDGSLTQSWGTGTDVNTYTMGVAFTVNVQCAVDYVSWRRATAVAGDKLTRLALYDGVSGALLWQSSSVPDDGSVGWQDKAVGSSVTLTANRRYVVAADHPGGITTSQIGPVASLASSDPYGYANPAVCYTSAGSYGYPNNAGGSGWLYGLSVHAYASGGTSGGATTGDIQAQLSSWFDPTDATYPTSSPKLYPSTIAGLATKIDNDGVSWDAKLGALQTYGSVGDKGISAGVEIVRQAVAGVQASLPDTSALAKLTDVQAAQAAIISAVNTARDAVNTNTNTQAGAILGAIASHDTQVAGYVADAQAAILADVDQRKDDVVTAVQAAQAAIGDAINAHDAGAKSVINAHTDTAVNGAVTAINAHTDQAAGQLAGDIATHDADVIDAINVAEGAINAHTDQAVTAINGHVDTALGPIAKTADLQPLATTAQLTAARDAINAHTDAAVAGLNVTVDTSALATKTDLSNAQTAIVSQIDTDTSHIQDQIRTHDGNVILSLQGQAANILAAITAETATIVAALGGSTGVLGLIDAVASVLAALTGLVADVATLTQWIKSGPSSFTSAGSAAFTSGYFLYQQAARRYVVDIAETNVRQQIIDLPTGRYLPRAGWCQVLYGDAYGEWHRLAFDKQRIDVGPGATGLLLYTRAGTTGSVEAFTTS